MRHDEIEVRVEQHGDGVAPGGGTAGREPSLGDLFKRLTSDTTELVRQEITLAKAELREATSGLAADATKIGVAAGLALMGGLALTAFLVIAIGNLLGDNYWLSALLVGLVALGVGAVLVRNALADIKSRNFKPVQTLATLREDKSWASQQARELKHELTTDPTSTTPQTRNPGY
jgi:uncharacterized membrane protein YqjE